MCATCKEILNRIDQAWLGLSEAVHALEATVDAGQVAALETALVDHRGEMIAARQELDDHHDSCRWAMDRR